MNFVVSVEIVRHTTAFQRQHHRHLILNFQLCFILTITHHIYNFLRTYRLSRALHSSQFHNGRNRHVAPSD